MVSVPPPLPTDRDQENIDKREGDKTALKRGNDNVLENLFVVVFLYPPIPRDGRCEGLVEGGPAEEL